MIDFAAVRRTMVDGQVRTADVTDLRLLAAMLELPRERFMPEEKAALAYLDLDVPVTDTRPARRLLKPMVLAKLSRQPRSASKTACSMSAAPPAIRRRCWPSSPHRSSRSRRIAALARQAQRTLADAGDADRHGCLADRSFPAGRRRSPTMSSCSTGRAEVLPERLARPARRGWAAPLRARLGSRPARPCSIGACGATSAGGRFSMPRPRCCRALPSRRPLFSEGSLTAPETVARMRHMAIFFHARVARGYQPACGRLWLTAGFLRRACGHARRRMCLCCVRE